MFQTPYAKPVYALAENLVGFPSSTLRVIVEHIEEGNAWVRTADLLDSGTPLIIDVNQLRPDPEDVKRGIIHPFLV